MNRDTRHKRAFDTGLKEHQYKETTAVIAVAPEGWPVPSPGVMQHRSDVPRGLSHSFSTGRQSCR